MAEAPSLIYNDTPGAVPASYRFPPGLDARLSSVSATFNGAGASGDFLACLSVYSQDGKLIGRYFPGSPVVSGDSAEVTFAPFLRESAAASAGGGIEFNAGTYGPDNVGDWLMIETDHFATIPFSLPSNVDPGNATGGGDAHNNKYGALYTVPVAAPFFVWALNVFVDARSPASGFANGIEVVVGTDGPSAKGIDMVVESEDGTGSAQGIGMSVSAGAGACTGISINADNTAHTARAIEVTKGLCQLGLPTSPGPAGTLWDDAGTVKVA